MPRAARPIRRQSHRREMPRLQSPPFAPLPDAFDPPSTYEQADCRMPPAAFRFNPVNSNHLELYRTASRDYVSECTEKRSYRCAVAPKLGMCVTKSTQRIKIAAL